MGIRRGLPPLVPFPSTHTVGGCSSNSRSRTRRRLISHARRPLNSPRTTTRRSRPTAAFRMAFAFQISRYGRFRGTGAPKCQSSAPVARAQPSDPRNPRSFEVQFCRVHGASKGVSRSASTIRRSMPEAEVGASKPKRSNHPGRFRRARRTCLLQLSPTPFRDVTYRSTRSFQYHRALSGAVGSSVRTAERICVSKVGAEKVGPEGPAKGGGGAPIPEYLAAEPDPSNVEANEEGASYVVAVRIGVQRVKTERARTHAEITA